MKPLQLSMHTLVLTALLSSTLSAQTVLPSCQGKDVSQWNGCRGVLDDPEYSYAGDFVRGKFEGRGILEFTADKYQGDYFQGEFKNGLKHGFGIYFFANGEKFAGQYQFGKRQGKGTYSFANGKPPLTGIWSNNQWVSPGNTVIESKNSSDQMQAVSSEAVKKKTEVPAVDKPRVRVEPRPVSTVDTLVAKPRDAVAIVLGVQSYQRLPLASFAANDARQFRDHAIKYLGVPANNTQLLIDADAQRTGILLALKYWLPAHVNAGSTDVYVFFSGHGLLRESDKQYYWLPQDVNIDLLEDTGLNQKVILALLSRSGAKSVTVFMDSCFSGNTRQGQVLQQHQRAVSIKSSADSLPPGVNLLSAVSSGQIAYADEALQHGIFSHYLLKGLAGESDGNHDQQIHLGELADYVSRQTSRHALGLHKQQDPQLSGDRQHLVVYR
jgi:hypothetical protein